MAIGRDQECDFEGCRLQGFRFEEQSLGIRLKACLTHARTLNLFFGDYHADKLALQDRYRDKLYELLLGGKLKEEVPG